LVVAGCGAGRALRERRARTVFAVVGGDGKVDEAVGTLEPA
jgi:hypothetical protein